MFHPTKRRITSVRTSGVDKQYPFQVEIASGFPLRCYLGRVSEKESIEAHGQQIQKSWPHRSNKVTQDGLQKSKAYNRTELQYKDYAVVTGSAKIHQISGHGRATYGSATAISADKGYAEWPRAGMQGRNYVILHREVDDPSAETPISKWCLSSVPEASITSSDIVVALVTNWQSVNQVWKSDVIWTKTPTTETEPPVGGGDHPWKVTANGAVLSIRDGSINNVTLSNPAYQHTLTENGEHSVLLKVTCVSNTYPNEVIWSVVKDWSPYTQNTLTEAWLKAAHVSYNNGVATITQLLFTSIMSERLKYGTALNSARYYFNRV